MRRFDDKKYWLKDLEVKESVSDRKVVEKMIIDIGKNICNDMMLRKYKKIVMDNNN
jgi:hypothetical protein